MMKSKKGRSVIFLVFIILLTSLSATSLTSSLFASENLLQKAEALFVSGKGEEGQKQIATFLGQQNDSKAYVQVGNVFARLKKWPEAVHYLEIAVSRNSKDALAWYELGIAQHQNKKTNNAVVSFKKSIAISSTTSKSVIALGEILELAHDRYDAREVYSSGLRKLGNRADLRAKLCWLNFQDSFFAEALSNCQKAVSLNPQDVTSATLLTTELYYSHKKEVAFLKFKDLIAKFPRAALPYRSRGLIYFQEQSYEEAVADLGKAFGLDPNDDEAGIHLARALFELKHYEHALPIYYESCRLNKTYRFEFLSRQRELGRKKLNDLAQQYQEFVDKI